MKRQEYVAPVAVAQNYQPLENVESTSPTANPIWDVGGDVGQDDDED